MKFKKTSNDVILDILDDNVAFNLFLDKDDFTTTLSIYDPKGYPVSKVELVFTMEQLAALKKALG